MGKSLIDIILTQVGNYSDAAFIVDSLRELFNEIFIILFAFVFLSQISKNLFAGKGLIMNWPEFMRILMLAFLFTTYNSTVGGIGKVADSMNIHASNTIRVQRDQYVKAEFINLVKQSSIPFTQEELELLENSATTSVSKNKKLLKRVVKDVKKREADVLTNVISAGIKVQSVAKNVVKKFIVAIIYFISQAVESIMVLFLLGLDKVLYSFGILAVMFSLLPFWKDKFTTWFGTWIVVKFSFLSIVILNEINKLLVMGEYNLGGLAIGTDTMELGISVTSLVLYIMIIWLTSRYVGSGEAGRVLSTAMAVVTTAMGAAVAARMGGNGGGANLTGGGNVGGNISGDIASSGANMASSSVKSPGES